MKYEVTINNKKYEVEVEKGQASLTKTEEISAKAVPQEVPVVSQPQPNQPLKPSTAAEEIAVTGGQQLKSPMPGTILEIRASEGQKVKKGEIIFILEAMKMENEIMAPNDCTVIQINTSIGSSVKTGDLLAILQ